VQAEHTHSESVERLAGGGETGDEGGIAGGLGVGLEDVGSTGRGVWQAVQRGTVLRFSKVQTGQDQESVFPSTRPEPPRKAGVAFFFFN